MTGAPPLSREEVHLWDFLLEGQPAGRLEALSADERARAERYHFPRDASRYAAARGALRAVLGLYLGVRAEDVLLRYGAQGKPEVDGSLGVRFNLSHSDARAVVAVCRDRDIGVDIELVRPVPDAAAMIERFFSAAAKRSFAALAAHERDEGFLRLWTRQEAYLKARGEGLTGPLDESPDAHWQIREFSLATEYVGALAVRGPVASVRRLSGDQLFSK